MKKYLLAGLFVAVALGFAGSAFAETNFALSPAAISVKAGQTFNLNLAIGGNGAKIFTGKAEIKFPADLLSVSDFSFGKNWLPLTSDGYDSADNVSGILIKTAGYPGGIDSSVPFGTIVFKAKKSGEASVRVGENSLALDTNGQNALGAALASANVSIAESAPKPAPVVEVKPIQIQNDSNAKIAPTNTETTASSTFSDQSASVAASGIGDKIPLSATIGSALSFGTGNKFLAILTLLAGFLIIGYAIYFAATKMMR